MSYRKGVIGVALSLLVSALNVACQSQSTSSDHQPQESAVVQVALTASAEEGILVGEPLRVQSAEMTLDEAEEYLTAWGAVFAEFPDYPPADTAVWVVQILGEGVQPGPPGSDTREECLDIRVVVIEETMEELVLFGKLSSGC